MEEKEIAFRCEAALVEPGNEKEVKKEKEKYQEFCDEWKRIHSIESKPELEMKLPFEVHIQEGCKPSVDEMLGQATVVYASGIVKGKPETLKKLFGNVDMITYTLRKS